MKKIVITSAAILCAVFAQSAFAQTDTLEYSPVGKTILSGTAESYPAADMRNSLAGLIPGLEVLETSGSVSPYTYSSALNSSLASSNVSLISRGSSNVTCMVDGVFVPFNSLLLDLSQIESITLVDGIVDKAKLGVSAGDGVLCIKTRGGGYNAPLKVNASVESGVGIIDRFPEWVSGYDYVRLNNYARASSGYTPLYNNPSGFLNSGANDMTYPNVDYRSLMLKDTKPLYKAGVSVSGGSARTAYSGYLGFLREEGIYKENNNNFNRFNLSSSIRTTIGDWIEAGASFIGGLHFYNDNIISLTDFRTTPAVAFPLIVTTDNVSDEYEGLTSYGVSRSFTENHYAELLEGGFSQTRLANGNFKAFVDVDMSWLLKGLKSTTEASLQSYYTSVIGKTNDYLAYYYEVDTGTADGVSDHKGVKATGKSLTSSATYQQLMLKEDLGYDWSRNGHSVDLDAVFYLQACAMSTNTNHLRQADFFLSGNYSYLGKYSFDAVLQIVGSHTLPRENRYAAFPTFGLSWNISKEDFMKSVSFVEGLKLRAQYGIIGYGSLYGTDFRYNADYSLASGFKYGPVSSYQWFGSNTRTSKTTTLNRIGNDDLEWQKRHQLDINLSGRLFGAVDFSVDYFNINDTDLICDVTDGYPNVSGWSGITVYGNNNAMRTSGVEAAVSYTRRFGDFKLTVGGNIASYNSVWTKYLSASSDSRVYEGHSVNDIWGYKFVGKCLSASDIASAPKHLDDLQIGDLLYEDVNDDDEISDLDKQSLGHTDPLLRYSVNLRASWKSFDLTVVGTGRAFYQVVLDNAYFQNGWGDSNYSKFVLENLGGAYPRLSYTKSANNFVTSDFWIRNGDFFKIQNVELAYNFPKMRLFLRGANLLTISGIKDVDPEYINSGVSAYPLFRTFTTGIKLSF